MSFVSASKPVLVFQVRM